MSFKVTVIGAGSIGFFERVRAHRVHKIERRIDSNHRGVETRAVEHVTAHHLNRRVDPATQHIGPPGDAADEATPGYQPPQQPSTDVTGGTG